MDQHLLDVGDAGATCVKEMIQSFRKFNKTLNQCAANGASQSSIEAAKLGIMPVVLGLTVVKQVAHAGESNEERLQNYLKFLKEFNELFEEYGYRPKPDGGSRYDTDEFGFSA